ncbi:unnamed protein product [Ectocarpus sp. 13 AM-2016]
MFLCRTPGDRFPHDETRGPELRQGLDLFRVINRTGLQIRRGVGLNSEPCGRLFAGDVFCVNRCSAVPHRQENKRGKMRQLRLTRLHMVQPYTGWVTWSSKWVEKFQGGDTRPGPIPLKSTLRDNCPVSMVKPSDACSVRGGASSRCDPSKRCGPRHEAQGTHTEWDVLTHQESRTCTPRTTWLHARDGVWPVDVKSIPGPKYFPSVSGANRDHCSAEYGVLFPKERRFLSNATRYLSKGHERQARGVFSPGPAMYVGHDEILPLAPRPPPPASAPGSSRCRQHPPSSRTAGTGEGKVNVVNKRFLRRPRAVTAGSRVEIGARRRRQPVSGTTGAGAGSPYIGLKEQGAADKIVGKANAGTTGCPVIRTLVSSRGEREGPDGCFVTRMGAESPGPASHYPNVSSISSRGCPVFATPTALDAEEWERRNKSSNSKALHHQPAKMSAIPKTSQVHRRWPAYTHLRDEGRISGNLGQDSPGPGAVNIADHDPFRASSFLKMDVCHPPPASNAASFPCRVPFGQ